MAYTEQGSASSVAKLLSRDPQEEGPASSAEPVYGEQELGVQRLLIAVTIQENEFPRRMSKAIVAIGNLSWLSQNRQDSPLWMLYRGKNEKTDVAFGDIGNRSVQRHR